MENLYSVNEILEKVKISKATFYNEKKKNQDFFTKNQAKVKANGKKNKPTIKYNQVVLDRFLSIYGENASNSAGTSQSPFLKNILMEGPSADGPEGTAEGSNTKPSPTLQEPSQGQSIGESTKNPLETKIEALEAEILALKTQLEKAEGERADLINQNGNLLLLLSQEKAEKQLLLPGPKKSIGARIKGLFHKK
jgi:hypothetical protein